MDSSDNSNAVAPLAIRITTGAEAFVAAAELNHFQGNLKKLAEENYQKLKGEILDLGFTEPISVWKDPEGKLQVLNGHQRLRTVRRMVDEGYVCPDLPVNLVHATDLREAHKKVLALTSQYGEMTKEGLQEFLDLSGLDALEVKESFRFPEIDWKDLDEKKQSEGGGGGGGSGAMLGKFGVPPFTILDTRQGYWHERRDQWKKIGIKSELGRPGKLLDEQGLVKDINEGTSIFDPVLCELAYSWFCPVGGVVLDPFAGGSVRGVVASHMGRQYVGIELRAEQVAANREQEQLCKDPVPVWHQGDSLTVLPELDLAADLIIGCPPYFDLEQYSEDPRDLSNMDFAAFLCSYGKIIAAACDKLKDNRFAVWVISDVRDKKTGLYRGLVSSTIAAFQGAGCELYNEAVLVNSVGTLHLRAGKYFTASRKLGRCHQDVLVFLKGDTKLAVEACGDVEVHLPGGDSEVAELPAGEG